MPGPPQQRLTAAERRRLLVVERKVERARADLELARERWAVVVRELGISAVSRELGVTVQALSQRVGAIERGTER